jgi:hypothetical protein
MPRFTQYTAAGLAAVALVIAGCGGDDGGSSDEDQITELVQGISEEPLTICEHLTADTLAQLGTVEECKQAGEQAGEAEPSGEAEISELQVDGDTATATVTDDDGADDVKFAKEDGEWKVDGTS